MRFQSRFTAVEAAVTTVVGAADRVDERADLAEHRERNLVWRI
jgi:hypothetical protein